MARIAHFGWACGGALLTLAALHGHSAPPEPKTLVAEQFRLVDARGNTRAVLSCAPDGSPSLLFEDAQGHARAQVGMKGSRSIVNLDDGDGKARVQLLVEEDGAVGLALHDAQGQARVTLNLAPDGSPTLALRDKTGVPRASLEIFKGKPYFNLSDDQSQAAAAMLIGATNEPTILLRDKDGKPLWGAP